MGFASSATKTAIAGILAVVIASFIVYVVSLIIPARPVLYFIAWAFIAMPLALVITGWLAAQAAYFACLGPNKSMLSAVGIALISAVAGIALWVIIASLIGVPEQMRLFSASIDRYGYVELIVFLIMYALAGSIGGAFHYFTLQGRKCDIKSP